MTDIYRDSTDSTALELLEIDIGSSEWTDDDDEVDDKDAFCSIGALRGAIAGKFAPPLFMIAVTLIKYHCIVMLI